VLRWCRFRAAAPYLHGSVLDYGCGEGELYEYLRPESYFGIDRNAEEIEVARLRHPAAEFGLEIPSNSFYESAACLAVVEHLPDPGAALEEIRKHLRPGGTLVITTPNPTFRRLHDCGAALGLCSREAADEHEKFLGRDGLELLCRQCGFEVCRYTRFLSGMNQALVCSLKG
jgi:SAM-dependent methyltransferase